MGIRAVPQDTEAANGHVELNTVRHCREEESGAMFIRHPIRPWRRERASQTSANSIRPGPADGPTTDSRAVRSSRH